MAGRAGAAPRPVAYVRFTWRVPKAHPEAVMLSITIAVAKRGLPGSRIIASRSQGVEDVASRPLVLLVGDHPSVVQVLELLELAAGPRIHSRRSPGRRGSRADPIHDRRTGRGRR